ncbi:hypothetical protein L9F63_007721, partial [Diploptera punctata]
YTCFSVSKNFIIFGATSGGLYVFKREPCIFLQILPNKEGSVTQVSTSPDEKFFAFSTQKGLVCVLERSQNLKIRRTQMSVEHQGSEVTALHWNTTSTELFVGDDAGKVSVVNISPFTAKNMFQHPTFPLLDLDSRIVQLDWCSELLLVSTVSRCYICDTFKEQYRQIGQKLREGDYGACFYTAGDQSDLPARSEVKQTSVNRSFSSLNEGEKLPGYEGVQNLKIFCSRPGSRLWQVHIDGSVLSTLQFKQAFANPPVEIIRPYKTDGNNQEISTLKCGESEISQNQHTFNFTKLFIIANKFVFTYKYDGMCILDPVNGDVILWTNCFEDIIDVKIINDVIYIWTASGNFHSVGMLPLDKFLVRLYLRKQYTLCAQLCVQHSNYLLELVPTSSKLKLLADLGNKLDSTELSIKISPLLEEITKNVQERQNAQRLQSGIFLVGNSQYFWNEESEIEDSRESLPSCSQVQSLRVDKQKEKSKSLSASPEIVQRKRSWAGNTQKRTASTLSLPDLVVENKLELNDPSKTSDNAQGSQSNDLVNSSDLTFPPEAIQTFRDLKQNFSWKMINAKSLKEKWQMLEDKMKLLNLDTNSEPLDKMRRITNNLFVSALMKEDKDDLCSIICLNGYRIMWKMVLCVCGFPLLNSPMVPYPELAELMVVYYWENSQGRLLEICKSVPSLWHLILPRNKSERFIISLIIHLENAVELANWMPSLSYQDWDKTLELLVLFRCGTCLNCGNTFTAPNDEVKGISYSSLGSLLMKSLGPHKAIQLLSKYSSHIDPGELDERFFQTCIFSAIVDSHTEGLRNQVIDLFTECTTKTENTSIFSPVCSLVESVLK